MMTAAAQSQPTPATPAPRAFNVRTESASEIARAAKDGDYLTWPTGQQPGRSATEAERHQSNLERLLKRRGLRLVGLTVRPYAWCFGCEKPKAKCPCNTP